MKLLALISTLLFRFPYLQSTQQPATTAVAVFQQMIAATSWSTKNVPADALARGTVRLTENGSQETFSISVKAKGCHLFRIDVQYSDGTHSTIVNDDAAAVIAPDGQMTLPSVTALSMNSFEVPFFCLSSALAAPNLSLTGTETVAGQSAYKVEVNPVPSVGDPLASTRQFAGQFTISISTSSGLPIQLSSRLVSSYNPTSFVTVLRVFSDFRVVDGIAVPFHQEQFANGQLLSSLQLDSVAFNVGIADSDLAISSTQD